MDADDLDDRMASWQAVVAAATYAAVEVMVNSSSCSVAGSHLEYLVEDSPESMYQRLESASQYAPRAWTSDSSSGGTNK